MAKPQFPKARTGLFTNKNDDENNDDDDSTDVTSSNNSYNAYKISNPVRWVNIRGRNDIILNQNLDCFLCIREWYKKCLRNGVKIIQNTDLHSQFIKSRKNGKFREPYVFTNLYNGGQDCNDMHGLGWHKDDVDWFSVVILVSYKDDINIGSLLIKNEETNTIDKICLEQGDAVVLAKGVSHCVPTVKRSHDRMSLNVFF